jgi:hypothetical protein
MNQIGVIEKIDNTVISNITNINNPVVIVAAEDEIPLVINAGLPYSLTSALNWQCVPCVYKPSSVSYVSASEHSEFEPLFFIF